MLPSAATAISGGSGSRGQSAARPLALEDRGDGDPLVLVHGFATSRHVWLKVASLLERDRRVVALDVPGFGDSPPAGPGFEIGVVADAIADGLAAAGVPEPYDLVGHSLGGAIALTLAARRPDLVRRLVLIAPAGFMPAPPLGGRPVPTLAARAVALPAAGVPMLRRAAAPLADFAWGRRLLLAFVVSEPAAISPAHARLLATASRGASRLRPALAAAMRADLRQTLVQTKAPLGLIWGARDRVVPPRVAETILALRPEAPCVTIERAGHVVMAERPEQLASTLLQVLERSG